MAALLSRIPTVRPGVQRQARRVLGDGSRSGGTGHAQCRATVVDRAVVQP